MASSIRNSMKYYYYANKKEIPKRESREITIRSRQGAASWRQKVSKNMAAVFLGANLSWQNIINHERFALSIRWARRVVNDQYFSVLALALMK